MHPTHTSIYSVHLSIKFCVSCDSENCNENWIKKIWKNVADKYNVASHQDRLRFSKKFYPKCYDHDDQWLSRRLFPYWLVFVPTITNHISYKLELAEDDCIYRFPLLSKDIFKMCKLFVCVNYNNIIIFTLI